jgi:putative membrane protein
MEFFFNTKPLLGSIVYSILGIVVFWVSFIIVDKITPYDLWREIVKERNLPLAIIVAAMCLGIAIIVAAAIHG